MTHFDVMARVLSNATGKPLDEIRQMIEIFDRSRPSPKLREEISDAEAQEMIARMGGDKAGILNWLSQGAARAAANPTAVRKIEQNWSSWK
jgi:hypothetical protein